MDDDVDTLHAPPSPTPAEMRRALEYIASYAKWDFSRIQDPHKWCAEFIDVAKSCLEGKRTFV